MKRAYKKETIPHKVTKSLIFTMMNKTISYSYSISSSFWLHNSLVWSVYWVGWPSPELSFKASSWPQEDHSCPNIWLLPTSMASQTQPQVYFLCVCFWQLWTAHKRSGLVSSFLDKISGETREGRQDLFGFMVWECSVLHGREGMVEQNRSHWLGKWLPSECRWQQASSTFLLSALQLLALLAGTMRKQDGQFLCKQPQI